MRIRALLTAGLLSIGVVGLIPTATANAAPAFQLPFPCNQTWNGNSSNSSAHRSHEIDFNRGSAPDSDLGDTVVAAAEGTVRTAANQGSTNGYGNLVKIDHGRGIETRYGHLSAIMVSPGQRIARGQQIGRMGSTGRSTGSHLHYEVRIDGRAVNPIPFMKSTDYLLAMQRNDGGVSMDGGHVALGGPKSSPK